MGTTTPRRIAAAVVQRTDGKVLLLKRAATHTTYPGKWCFVTGYVEAGEQPGEAAIRELGEELGVSAEPVRGGEIVTVELGGDKLLYVYPFLFRVEDFEVVLEREHGAYTWIEPHEVENYDTVPRLADDLRSLGL
ncbi:MAG: NUDIX domain-containing protein [Anaerolineae bacterium]|nr:NUDIX domain-containing protein [Anaerolineae bacterium]